MNCSARERIRIKRRRILPIKYHGAHSVAEFINKRLVWYSCFRFLQTFSHFAMTASGATTGRLGLEGGLADAGSCRLLRGAATISTLQHCCRKTQPGPASAMADDALIKDVNRLAAFGVNPTSVRPSADAGERRLLAGSRPYTANAWAYGHQQQGYTQATSSRASDWACFQRKGSSGFSSRAPVFRSNASPHGNIDPVTPLPP